MRYGTTEESDNKSKIRFSNGIEPTDMEYLTAQLTISQDDP